MKQVLAVRVGAKKAVGHICEVWWPTVPVAFSKARFQVKKVLVLAPWKISGMINI